jgi:translation initiation factor 1 (eIF-1/SUI1)
MSIKADKWFKEHKVNLNEDEFERKEVNLKKKELRMELKKLGIDTHKGKKITIINGIPHKVVDSKLKPLKKI